MLFNTAYAYHRPLIWTSSGQLQPNVSLSASSQKSVNQAPQNAVYGTLIPWFYTATEWESQTTTVANEYFLVCNTL